MAEPPELSPEIVALLEQVAANNQLLLLTLPSGAVIVISRAHEMVSSSPDLTLEVQTSTLQ